MKLSRAQATTGIELGKSGRSTTISVTDLIIGSLNREFSTLRHGIAGIDNEIGKDLLHLQKHW
ncbi:MAG: hypothetical protein AB1798_17990 [Spirochaetota bacterium]